MRALPLTLILALFCMIFGATAKAQDGDDARTQWVRTNLSWARIVAIPPQPIVDSRRIEQQIKKGCTATSIRFGDTAVMRQQVTPAPLEEATRRAVAFASFSRDYDTASSLLQEALDNAQLSPLQRQVLQNQQILTAIHFGRDADARDLLSQYSEQEGLPASLRSDQLFWSVLTDPSQSAQSWETQLLPRLDDAMAADPTSFQVLSWRVMGWMRAGLWKQGRRQCAPAMSDFSDRVLDLSEAGACPLMLSHLAFAFDRELAEQVVREIPPVMASWRHFAIGLLAVIVGDRGVHEQALSDLASLQGDTPCAASMQSELSQLGDRFVGISNE